MIQLKTFLVILLIGILCAERIDKDPNFPLMINTPSKNLSGYSIELRFKLPVRYNRQTNNQASGIGYGQFIGVSFFPENTFNFNNFLPTCYLSDEDGSYTVSTHRSVDGVLSEDNQMTNTVFCKLNDKTRNMLPPNKVLTLTLTFSMQFTFNYLHNVSLFTSTSNDQDMMIIDSLPVLGTASLYQNYSNRTLKYVSITNSGGSNISTITSSNNPDGNETLFPGFTVDLKINVEVERFFNVDPEDYLIYLKFSTNSLDMPNSIENEAFSTSENEGALTSNLSHIEMPDGIIITGFKAGDLYPERKFKIILRAMKTKDKELGKTTDLALYVYYLNTYSIISYSRLNMDQINPPTISGTAMHPENFYMYDGMAFPFKFSFSSNVEISTGAYVLIRHRDRDIVTNDLAFIASTCDLSGIDNNNDFSNTRNCFPIRNDFNYSNTGDSLSEGSGFYFKMGSISQETMNVVQIWAFINKCYGSTASENYAANLAFTIRLFKYAKVNSALVNEKVFFDDASSHTYLLANNLNLKITKNCFPLQTRLDIKAPTTSSGLNVNPYENNYIIPKVRSNSSAADLNLPIGIEINNINILNLSQGSDLSPLTNYRKNQWFKPAVTGKGDHVYNTSAYEVKYLFKSGAEETISNVNLFVVGLFITAPYSKQIYAEPIANSSTLTIYSSGTAENLYIMEGVYISDYFPNECITNTYGPENATATTTDTDFITLTKIIEPRIQWLFSKKFLTNNKDENDCQVSWLFIDIYDAKDNLDNSTLYYTTGVKRGIDTHLTTITGKTITIDSSHSSRSKTMEQDSTTIASGDSTFKVTSTKMFSGTTRLLSMTGFWCDTQIWFEPSTNPLEGVDTNTVATAAQVAQVGQIAVYTDCLKWNKNTTGNHWSTYFEMQQLIISSNKWPTRIVRYIKLYPEIGIFQSPGDLDNETTYSANQTLIDKREKWITGHYQITSYNQNPYSICLLELNARIINGHAENSSNALVMWLFATTLLDLDPDSSNNEYPTTSTKTAYGYNSGQTMSLNFRRIGDGQNLLNISMASGMSYPDVTQQGSANNYLSQFELYAFKTVFGLISEVSSTALDTARERADYAVVPGFLSKRSIYHFYMGSVIIIDSSDSQTNITSSELVNLYIPFLCPQAIDSTAYVSPFSYPSTGVYFTMPIATVAWATVGTGDKSFKSIDRYISPKAHTANIHKTFDQYADVTLNYNRTRGNTNAAIRLPIQIPITLSDQSIPTTAAERYYNLANLRWDNYVTATSAYNTQLSSMMSVYKALRIQFYAYNDTVNFNKMDIISGLDPSSPTEEKISAISIFLNESVGELEDSVSNNLQTNFNKFGVKKTSSLFYILGKPFNRFLGYSTNIGAYESSNSSTLKPIQIGSYLLDSSSNVVLPADTSANTNLSTFSTIIVTGIPRIDISYLDSSSKVDPTDFIAVFTHKNVIVSGISDTSTAGKIDVGLDRLQTNLRIHSNETDVYFILWHPDTSNSDWSEWNIGIAETNRFITEDKSANVYISGTLPSIVPVGSEVKIGITSSALQSGTTTICGISQNALRRKEIMDECTVSSPYVTCPFTEQKRTFYICCFNLSITSTEIAITSADLQLPYTDSIFSSSGGVFISGETAYNNIWYQPSSNSNFDSTVFGDLINASGSTFYPIINEMKYLHTNSENGIGKVIIDINLDRFPTRGMKIYISSDFSRMKISNIKTRIVASFGNSLLYNSNPDNADILIQSVESNLNDGITIKLKNIVYKCGLGIDNGLKIMAWPVNTYQYESHSYFIYTYGADDSATTRPQDVGDLTINSSPNLKLNTASTSVLNDTNYNNFCTILTPVPNIPGEAAIYTIECSFSQIDISSSDSTISNSNELLIVFPYKYYGDEQQDISCIYDNTEIQCYFIDKSMLSIRFNNNINLENTFQMKILNIINPYITDSSDVIDNTFLFSFNNSNFNTGFRRNYIKGYSRVPGLVNSDTTYGNIVFINRLCKHSFTIPQSDSSQAIGGNANAGSQQFEIDGLEPRANPKKINPSYRTVHTFAFTIDIANDSISTWESGFTFTGPKLIIRFPDDYKFNWFNVDIDADITAYTMNKTDFTVIEELKDFIKVKTVTVMGNFITITFENKDNAETTLKFDPYFQYFRIRLYDIPPPVENTVNTSAGKITTEGFQFILSNSTGNRIFKTWNNLNNFSKEDIISNRISSLLPKNKGFKYEFTSNKWIIDAIDKVNQRVNYLICNSGRYTKYHWKVRPTSNYLKPKKVLIELSNNSFMFKNPTANIVSTSIYSDIPFELGCSCEEEPGFAIINPSISEGALSSPQPYEHILPLSPIRIEIRRNIKGIIYFKQNHIVRRAGSTFLDFWVVEPSFEPLEVKFADTENALIEDALIPAGEYSDRVVFKMPKDSTQTSLSYSLPTPSTICYEFQYKTLDITIDKWSAIIPNNALTRDLFQFRNSVTDANLEKNSVKFIFTTVYTQIYIYAALTCLNDEFPSDQELRNQTITETERLRYFNEILSDPSTGAVSYDIVFKNLIRGTAYKVKIFIESTQGNETNRTSSSIIILNYTENSIIKDIMATKSFSPLCASYRFATRPGQDAKDQLLWYWQQNLASNGFYETGCVMAVDQYGTEIPGLPSVKNETNCGRSNCRFVEIDAYINNQTQLDVSETYTICAYSFSTCANDPLNYEEQFQDIVNSIPDTSFFLSILNVVVVPEFTITQVNENIVPTSPSVSNVKAESGSVTFDLVSQTPLVCFVRISSDSPPTEAEFESCGEGCTVINSSKSTENFKVNFSSTGLTGTPSIYAVCYSDMHCSTLSTGVINFGTFSTSSVIDNGNNQKTNPFGQILTDEEQQAVDNLTCPEGQSGFFNKDKNEAECKVLPTTKSSMFIVNFMLILLALIFFE